MFVFIWVGFLCCFCCFLVGLSCVFGYCGSFDCWFRLSCLQMSVGLFDVYSLIYLLLSNSVAYKWCCVFCELLVCLLFFWVLFTCFDVRLLWVFGLFGFLDGCFVLVFVWIVLLVCCFGLCCYCCYLLFAVVRFGYNCCYWFGWVACACWIGYLL